MVRLIKKKNNEFYLGGIASNELRSISQLKKISFDSEMIASDIHDGFIDLWRESIKEKDVNRSHLLDSLLKKYFAYIVVACGLDESSTIELLSENMDSELVCYLIPNFVGFCFRIYLNDDIVGQDDVIQMQNTLSILMSDLSASIRLSELSQLWLKTHLTLNGNMVEIAINEPNTKKLFYSQLSENKKVINDSFFGGINLEKANKEYNIKAFEKSYFYKYYDIVSFEERQDYMTKILNKEIEITKFNEPIVNFLCLFNGDELLAYYEASKDSALKSDPKNLPMFASYKKLLLAMGDKIKEVKSKINN